MPKFPGAIIPTNLTTVERDALASPSTGQLIFNTTTSSFEYWDGGNWLVTEIGGNGTSQNLDAGGRLRVSEITTLVDIKHLHDKQPLLIDEEIGGTATSVHSTSEARVRMTVNANADYVIRQTKQRYNYQSGKSQIVFETFDNFQPTTNVTKRVGYFTSNTTAPYNSDLDGFFLESNGTEVSFKVYKNGTVTSDIPQSSWDDPLDGTGPSGVTIDWTKSQVIIFDFLWLGVDKIRIFTDIDGELFPVHCQHYSNNIAGVYMSSPNKPIRYEIRSTGGSDYLDQICCSVGTEGSLNNVGIIRSYNTGNDSYLAQSQNNKYALFAFRHKAGFEDVVIDLITLNLLVTSSDSFLWEYQLNPSVTTPTFNPVDDGSLEIATFSNNTQISSDGLILDSGYVYQKSDARKDILNAIKLGMTIGGVRDIGVLTITPVTNGLNVFGGITYREII